MLDKQVVMTFKKKKTDSQYISSKRRNICIHTHIYHFKIFGEEKCLHQQEQKTFNFIKFSTIEKNAKKLFRIKISAKTFFNKIKVD